MKIEVEARVFVEFPQNGVTCILCHSNANKPCVLVLLDDTEDEGRMQALPLHVDCILSQVRLMPIENVHLLYKIARHPGAKPF